MTSVPAHGGVVTQDTAKANLALTRGAETALVHRIIVGVAIAVPVCIGLWVGLIALAVGDSAPMAGPIAMAVGIGVLNGLFFGTWAGFVATTHTFEELDHMPDTTASELWKGVDEGSAPLGNTRSQRGGRSAMRMSTACLRVALFAIVLLAIVMTFGASAAAQATTPPIRPNQHYVGLVNHKHVGAVIYVVCPGPAGGDRTGPPAGNQTVKVVRVTSGGGYTGSSANRIWAEFNKDSIHVVGFTTYNTPKAIPTSLQLPCSGTGTVTFTTCFGTLPCAANAKDDVVPVTFENLAV